MGEDFVTFGGGIGMIGFPFVTIFLILNAIKWNEKKSLLLDSWYVYLGWIISGIVGFFTSAYISNSSLPKGKNFLIMPFILIITLQACSLTGILYNRSRPKKEFSLEYRKEESWQLPSLLQICKTAFLVSILTSLMMWGLIVTLEVMNDKLSSHSGPQYGLYDN